MALLLVLLSLCYERDAVAAEATQPWWNAAWPYRTTIGCPGGEGDVAQATVTLAGRTTPDGRDLRLIDAAGRTVPFEILYHDPDLSTVLCFRATSDKPHTVWLYHGKKDAPAIDTRAPDPAEHQDAMARWNADQATRRDVIQKRKLIEDQLQAITKSIAHANQAASRPAAQPTTTAASPPQTTQPIAAPSPPDLAALRQREVVLRSELEKLVLSPEQPQPAPQQPWQRKRGVLLKIYRKARNENPADLATYRTLLSQSTLEGAGFREGISDGFNPFGTSLHYMSVYEGFLNIEKAGKYGFCTVSDDGSGVYINGSKIVEWYGPHGWGGSERGEKSGTIDLPQGVAVVSYLHENATPTQMAYLGWKPPGGAGFVPIPPAMWLSVRSARPTSVEARDKPLLADATLSIVSTLFIPNTDDRQATMLVAQNQSVSKAGKVVKAIWDMGDGVTCDGQKVEHVYFRLGRPIVTLTVTDDKGNSDTVRLAANVFQVDVVANYFATGNPDAYVKIASKYDPQKLARDDLEGLTEACFRTDQFMPHLAAASAFVTRFPKDKEVARIASDAAVTLLRPGVYNAARAEKMLATAIDATDDGLTEGELTLRRASILAWELGQPDAAAPLYESLYDATRAAAEDPKLAALVRKIAERTAKQHAKRPQRRKPSGPEERVRTLARSSLIGLGDVALLSDDRNTAAALYAEARKLDLRPIPRPEEMAKLGTYPFMVEDLLARGEHETALDQIDEWENLFPSQRSEGWTQYWRGKVLFVQQPGPRALRYLELCERLSPTAVFVPESLWLRANCLVALNRHAEALALLQRIRSDFTTSEYFQKAPELIAECNKHVTKP